MRVAQSVLRTGLEVARRVGLLEFCAPLIVDRAVIIFDDWLDATVGAARAGERRAFEEFLASDPGLSAEELESYSPGSAKVFLVTRAGSSDRLSARPLRGYA